jgi:rhamnulokinase
MTDTRNYLVVDLGAESGRTILGALDAKQLTLKETHRFSNGPVRLNDGLHWDVLRLWGEIKLGIASTVRSGIKIDSIGLDTWGVDFALLDRNHSLLSNPFHYRDARASFEVEEYQPIRTDDWDEAFSKLLKIMSF